jgi:hypothetical protein
MADDATTTADETAALSFEDSARRVGAYRFVEHRLFEVTGAWAVGGGDAVVSVHASEMSLQHAWHAELWEERLPAVAWADHERLTAAPDAVAAALDELAAADDPASRLAGLYRSLLPRLLITYDEHAAVTVPVTDGPVIRALTLVRRDEVDQLAAGTALLDGLLAGPGAARRADEAAARMEALLTGPAGLWDAGAGPGEPGP